MANNQLDTPDFMNDGRKLSSMLLFLLERRYLSVGDLRSMQLEEDESANNGFLIKEIIEIGRSAERSDIRAYMPNILHACHNNGHSLMMILHGHGFGQQVFLGGRRIIGKASGSTINYMDSLESAFKTYYGGLRMGDTKKGTDAIGLTDLLNRFGSISIITGIPSSKQLTETKNLQSLDRIARAAGNGRYAMVVVAEPVPPGDVDLIIDMFRRLKSEVHSRKSANVSETASHTKSESRELRDADADANANALATVNEFALLASAIMGMPLLGMLGMIAGEVGSREREEQTRKPHVTLQYSETNSVAQSREIYNAHAAFCEELLDEHIERLQSAKSNGWWNTAVYLLAENEYVLGNLEGAVKSLCSGTSSMLDPIRAIKVPSHAVRKSILEGKILKLKFGKGINHPLGKIYDHLSTCMNSTELSTLVHLPINEIPGIRFRRHADFSLSIPEQLPGKKDILIGTLYRDETALMNVRLTLEGLNRHAFIAGMTGYGKTNTCMQLLYEAYVKYKIPFLVIDPVKADYRNFLQLRELGEAFRVFSISPMSALPLRLNPFELLPRKLIRNNPGFLARHIDLLKAVFNSSFPNMNAGPLGYILEDALIEMYQQKGWNLFTSENKFYRENSIEEDWYALMPSLADLSPAINTVFEKKKYSSEISNTLKEGLLTRLSSMIQGNKGTVLGSRRSSKFTDLFDKPCLIEIKDLGDNDDKAFIMALLFTFLYEYAEAKRGDCNELMHLTLIEEAHRLLSAGDQKTSSETGDPRSKAVGMFTEMMAEMRGYGEGFLIADQSPSALNKNTIKNTNIKIIHRLAHPDDRRLAGDSVNLTIDQQNYLNSLDRGIAVLHEDRFEEAIQLKIFNFKDDKFGKMEQYEWDHLFEKMGRYVKKDSGSYLYRHSGCAKCDNPCTYFYTSRPELKSPYKIDEFGSALLAGDIEFGCKQLKSWQLEMDETIDIGLLYCMAVTRLEGWAEKWVGFRKSSTVRSDGGAEGLMKSRVLRALAGPTYSVLVQSELDIEIITTNMKGFMERYFQTPDIELKGCSLCGSRCLMKSSVEELLRDNTKQKRIAAYLEMSIVEEILAYSPFTNEQVRKNWLHCVETHFPEINPRKISIKK